VLLDLYDLSERFFTTAIEVDAGGALRFVVFDLFRVGHVLMLRQFNSTELSKYVNRV